MKTVCKLPKEKVTKATLESTAEEKIFETVKKLPTEERTAEAKYKPQAKGKTPRARQITSSGNVFQENT